MATPVPDRANDSKRKMEKIRTGYNYRDVEILKGKKGFRYKFTRPNFWANGAAMSGISIPDKLSEVTKQIDDHLDNKGHVARNLHVYFKGEEK